MIETDLHADGPNTILVIDVDQTVTRAVLCDVVEGLARLVDVGEAATTAGAPFFDMSIGLNRAIRRLEDQTGRRIVDGEAVVSPSHPDGDGADAVFVTGVPVSPIRTGLLSLGSPELTHVLRSSVRRTVSVLSEAADYFRWAETTISPTAVESWLRYSRPTVLVLIAGDSRDEDWRSSLEVIASVGPEFGTTQGIIVGNDERQQVAAEVLDESFDLSGIDPAEYDPNEIASAVESELRDQYASSLHREPSLRMFSSGTFVDRVQSVESVVAFLHRRMGRRLAALLCQNGTLIEVASDTGALSVYRGDLDIGGAARSLIQIPSSNIARWVPAQMTDDEVRHWLLNRALRPLASLYGPNDMQVAAGAIRETALLAARHSGIDDHLDVDLVVLGRDVLDNTGDAAPLVALDALRVLPSDGLVMLSVDRDNIVASLGALSAGQPDYAREVIENDFLSPLASCIVLNGDGHGQAGNQIAEVEIAFDGGERQQLTLQFGDVTRVPLAEGQTAEVTVRPIAEFSVGLHAAGEPVAYSDERVVHGGELGILFDCRGRPVALPEEREARHSTLQRWSAALDVGKG